MASRSRWRGWTLPGSTGPVAPIDGALMGRLRFGVHRRQAPSCQAADQDGQPAPTHCRYLEPGRNRLGHAAGFHGTSPSSALAPTARRHWRKPATPPPLQRFREQRSSLYAKRLERGRFLWPSPADGVVSITSAQLGYMLEGIDWRHPQRTWRPTVAG